jgi:hypothetical protein
VPTTFRRICSTEDGARLLVAGLMYFEWFFCGMEAVPVFMMVNPKRKASYAGTRNADWPK